MLSKTEAKQIIKPIKQDETATAANAAKNNIIIKPFEGYKSYNIYYKAHVLYNAEFINPQIVVLRSYESDIAIYNRRNGFLLLNKEYYNSSKTTKEQLEHFKFKYIPAFIQGEIFLNDSKFNEMLNAFYESDPGLYENKEYNIIKTWKAQKSLINTINCKYLNIDEKITEILPLAPESTEKITLKTRFKIIEHLNKYGVKFDIVKTWKGSPDRCKYRTQDLLKIEIKIKDAGMYQDMRSFKDKIIWTGIDMGVTNTKELKRRNENRSFYNGYY